MLTLYNTYYIRSTYEKAWVMWSKEDLLIKGCMYWAEFSGESESNNENTVNIKINKDNVINTESLNYIMEKIAREEWP